MYSPLPECRLCVHIFTTYLIVLQILFFNPDRLRNFYGATISSWFFAVIQIPGTWFFFLWTSILLTIPQFTSHLPGKRSKRPERRTCGCILMSTTTRHPGWLGPSPHGIWAGLNSQKAAYHRILCGSALPTMRGTHNQRLQLGLCAFPWTRKTNCPPNQPLLPGPSPPTDINLTPGLGTNKKANRNLKVEIRVCSLGRPLSKDQPSKGGALALWWTLGCSCLSPREAGP